MDAWTSLCEGPDAVPLEVAGGRVFVAVDIQGANGTERLRFHVDTGGNTPGLMLTSTAAAQLGVERAEQLPTSIAIGGKTFELPKGARWTILSEEATSADRFRRKGFSVGQLGAGFLSRYLVCIDPATKHLALSDPERVEIAPGDATFTQLFLQKLGSNQAVYPFVHVQFLEGTQIVAGYVMLVDSGASSSMIEQGQLDYLHKQHAKWRMSTGSFGDADMLGGAMPEQVLEAPALRLNTMPSLFGTELLGSGALVSRARGTFQNMFGNLRPIGIQGALGGDVLTRFRVIIDYTKARLYVAPVPNATPPNWNRVGLSVGYPEGDCPVVQLVSGANAAAKRLVKPKDVLLEVGPRDACKLWHHELMEALSGEVRETRRLLLQRSGKRVEVSVPIVQLLR
ncbi:MAG: hypothetical protein R3B07_08210 [Polyangiaceae bacterium]